MVEDPGHDITRSWHLSAGEADQKISALFLVDNLGNGGGNYAIFKYAYHLSMGGHRILLCTARRHGWVQGDEWPDFPPTYREIVRPRIPRFTKGFGLLDRIWRRIYDRFILPRLLAGHHVDWVFGVQQADAIRAARLGRAEGLKIGNFVFESPDYIRGRLGLTPDEARKTAKAWRPFARALSRSDVVFPISETVKREVEKWTPVSRSEVIYAGIDAELLERVGDLEQRNQIIYVGRLTSYKNVEEILTALSRIEDPPELVICGDGDTRPDLEVMARELDVPCVFRGWVSEREKWEQIKSSLFMVSPSSFGGLPAAEALCCKIPCLALDIPFMREIYGDHLEYVREHDVGQMADVMSRLLADPVYRVRRGQAGFEYIRNKLSWDKSAAKIARIAMEST